MSRIIRFDRWDTSRNRSTVAGFQSPVRTALVPLVGPLEINLGAFGRSSPDDLALAVSFPPLISYFFGKVRVVVFVARSTIYFIAFWYKSQTSRFVFLTVF